MKKIFTFLALMLVFIGQLSAKTVTIGLWKDEDLAAIECRNGGKNGEVLEMTREGRYDNPTVEVTDGLYIACIKPASKFMVSTYYGGEAHFKDVVDNGCFLTMDELDQAEGAKVSIELALYRNVKIKVEDPEVIVVSYETDGDPVKLKEGVNELSLSNNDSFCIRVADPEAYKLTRFYNVKSNEEYSINNYTSAKVSNWNVSDGDEYGYEVTAAADFKAPTIRVRVDAPDDVTVKIGYDYEVKGFVANEWKEVELPTPKAEINIRHKNFEDIYNVLLNGEPQTSSYGYSFYVNVVDGDELDVVVYPEAIDYTVTVAVDPAECSEFIKSVSVADEDADHQTGEFTVRNGKKIKLNFNTDFYNLLGLTINDKELNLEDEYVGNYYTLKVTGDTDIVVKAEKKPVYTFILDVDHADGIKAMINYNNLDIKDGENVIEYVADKNRLSIEPAFGAEYNYLGYVKDGKDVQIEEPSPTRSEEILLDESISKVKVRVTPMELDKEYVTYYDISQEDLDKIYYNWGSFHFYSPSAGQSSYSESARVKPGYTVNRFADPYLPFQFYFSVYDDEIKAKLNEGFVYLNGEKYDKGTYYWIFDELEDQSVIKVYVTKEPATFSATLSADDEAEFTVIKDRIIPVDDLSTPITDLEDTEIELIPADGKDIEVYVSGATRADEATKLVADENGHYVVRLDSDKSVSVKAAEGTGVNSIFADAEKEGIYTMTGICVSRKADKGAVEALPAGIYVIDGKKVVKK